MENLQKAIDATKEKNPTGFKEVVSAEPASRLYTAINTKKESISKTVTANSETNWILAFSFLGTAGLIATFCASKFKS